MGKVVLRHDILTDLICEGLLSPEAEYTLEQNCDIVIIKSAGSPVMKLTPVFSPIRSTHET